MNLHKQQAPTLGLALPGSSTPLRKRYFEAHFEALQEAVLRTPYRKKTLPAVQSPSNVPSLNMLTSKSKNTKSFKSLKNLIHLPPLEKAMKSPQSIFHSMERKVHHRVKSRDEVAVFNPVKTEESQQINKRTRRPSKTLVMNGSKNQAEKGENMNIAELLANLDRLDGE